MTKEKYTLFYGISSPFSQFHPSPFVLKGKSFKCAEQYYAYKKARVFGDHVIAKKIMSSKSPRKMKMLGRKVSGFDEGKWRKRCRHVVRKASIAKYTQNDKLRRKLFQTAGTVLVEASPWDRIWGIGLSKTDHRSLNKKLWRGNNWLGYILTEVRDKLMQSER